MLLDGRKALVWGTILAALACGLWLGATDGSLPRLGADIGARAETRTPPALLLRHSAPAPNATSSAR